MGGETPQLGRTGSDKTNDRGERTEVKRLAPKTTVFLDGGVEKVVREYFSDIPALIPIAKCESGFTHFLKDGSVLRGKVHPPDSGVMQINVKAHGERLKKLGLDPTDLEDNLKFARILYNESGVHPWVCARMI